jgi:hypothetical protein
MAEGILMRDRTPVTAIETSGGGWGANKGVISGTSQIIQTAKNRDKQH